jgi:hypothetical protein
MITPYLDRIDTLALFKQAVQQMLAEKVQHYGEKGGFFETNAVGSYTHAIGEAKLKLTEFANKRDLRILIKAAAWIYLIYETEVLDGPK